MNDPPATSFCVYRAIHPDSEYVMIHEVVEVEGVDDSFWTDSGIESDVRYWYEVSAVRDYIESELSEFVSGRSVDLTDGVFGTGCLVAYTPEDSTIMLAIYPPNTECTLKTWEYMIFDFIRITCEGSVIASPSPVRIYKDF